MYPCLCHGYVFKKKLYISSNMCFVIVPFINKAHLIQSIVVFVVANVGKLANTLLNQEQNIKIETLTCLSLSFPAKNSLLSNLRVLLLEASPKSNYQLRQEYSNRVVALNQNTKALMNSLNIWQHVENMRLQPVRYMQVCMVFGNNIILYKSSKTNKE